jgi:hypothetical protein
LSRAVSGRIDGELPGVALELLTSKVERPA